MRKSPFWRRLELISSRRHAYRLCEQSSFQTSSLCFGSLIQSFQTVDSLKTLVRAPLIPSLLSSSFFCLSLLCLNGCTQSSCEKTLTCPESGGGSGQSDDDSDSDGIATEGSGARGSDDEGSGASSSEGTGAQSNQSACDEKCAGSTPLCDAESGQCVGCIDEQDCPAEKPLCLSATRKCSECRSTNDCTSAGASFCNALEGQCEGCRIDNDCAHLDDKPLCSEGQCVECTDAQKCSSAAASACSASGTCEPCQSAADCSHLSGLNQCAAGVCVECTPATEASDCGLTACNPASNTCTLIERNTQQSCKPCVSDSECITDHRCLPMTFGSGMAKVDRAGGYCLKLVSAGCVQPYSTGSGERVSLSGETVTNACSVNETFTTCEAVLDYLDGKDCTSSSDCGAAELADARCETVGVLAQECTYTCSGSSSQCEASQSCGNTSKPAEDPWCGGG